jgi:small subunit ribosomal protein S6
MGELPGPGRFDRLKRFAESKVANREEVTGMYPYETLVIVDARLSDEDVTALLTRLADNFKARGAEIGKVENWGKRRLTYEIGKQREGSYAIIEASAEPAMIKEFERQLKLNEQVLRYLSTRVPVRKRARAAAKADASAPAATTEEVG